MPRPSVGARVAPPPARTATVAGWTSFVTSGPPTTPEPSAAPFAPSPETAGFDGRGDRPPVQWPVVRIAFATTTPEVLGYEDIDRPLHEEAFARAGVGLDHCVWWDPEIEWNRYDLVVIRSTWDYVSRLEEYRQWLWSVDRLGILRNPAELVAWNIFHTSTPPGRRTHCSPISQVLR